MRDRIPIEYYEALSHKIKWADGKPSWIHTERIAGHIHSRGYRRVTCTINGIQKHIRSARLRWYMKYNELPEMIDHKNRIKTDDRIENLRACTYSQNNINTSKAKGKSSKYIGVSWYKPRNKWQAHIRIQGKLTYLGLFDNERVAAIIRDRAAALHHGEYARVNIK